MEKLETAGKLILQYMWMQVRRHGLQWGGRLSKFQYIALSAVMGLVGGLVATGYGLVLKSLMELVWVTCPRTLIEHTPLFDTVPSWTYIIVVCLLFGLLMGCCRAILPEPGEMGEMIRDVRALGLTQFRDLIPVTVLTLVSILSGASVGPEAAVVLIASNLGAAFVPYITRSIESRRILTLSLQGAALSAFFNLPVAGAFFVLEIQSRENLEYTEAVTATTLASVIGVLISTTITGDSIGDHLVFSEDSSGGSMFLFEGILVGIGAAVIGTTFALLVNVPKPWLHRLFHVQHFVWPPAPDALTVLKAWFQHRIRLWPLAAHFLPPLIGSLIVGITGALFPPALFWSEKEISTVISNGEIPLPHVVMKGIVPILYEDGTYVWWTWGVVAVLKVVLIAVSLHAGFVGGIIFPLFYVGFCTGQFFASLTSFIPPIFLMLGLASAVEASITRTPFGSAIALTIMHRMTNPHETALLPGILVATYTAMLLTTDSVRVLRTQTHRFGWALLRNVQELGPDCMDCRDISMAEVEAMEVLLANIRAEPMLNTSLALPEDPSSAEDSDFSSVYSTDQPPMSGLHQSSNTQNLSFRRYGSARINP